MTLATLKSITLSKTGRRPRDIIYESMARKRFPGVRRSPTWKRAFERHFTKSSGLADEAVADDRCHAPTSSASCGDTGYSPKVTSDVTADMKCSSASRRWQHELVKAVSMCYRALADIEERHGWRRAHCMFEAGNHRRSSILASLWNYDMACGAMRNAFNTLFYPRDEASLFHYHIKHYYAQQRKLLWYSSIAMAKQ